MTSKGFIFLASSGNEGPYKSSATSPCTLQQVICVGMLDKDLKDISSRSSSGIKTSELYSGISLMSPDVLIPGENLLILDGTSFGKCEVVSGTSFSVSILSAMIAGYMSAARSESDDSSFMQMHNTAYFK